MFCPAGTTRRKKLGSFLKSFDVSGNSQPGGFTLLHKADTLHPMPLGIYLNVLISPAASQAVRSRAKSHSFRTSSDIKDLTQEGMRRDLIFGASHYLIVGRCRLQPEDPDSERVQGNQTGKNPLRHTQADVTTHKKSR